MELQSYQIKRPMMLIVACIALLIPGVRRFIFFRLIKNRSVRNLGLQLILSTPFLRDRMMNKLLPSRLPQE
jgi:hypothetical protein